jgi:uncharacterized membrane protein YfcA
MVRPTVADAGTRRDLVLQWAVVLVPPSAWAFQFLASYNLADSLGCSPGSPQALRTDAHLPLTIAVVTGISALACIVAGVLALRYWHRVRSADVSPGRRAEWMARAGIMVSALFLLIIATGFLPLLVLHSPCAPSL